MFKNPYFRVAAFTLMLVGAIATAGSIKTWNTADTLTASDLNANFQHIHNNMVGGHGARLVDADVSTSANINYTKLQNGRGIARAFAALSASACGTPATCTLAESMNITSVVGTASTGVYTVTLAYTATDSNFVIVASPGSAGGSTAGVITCTGLATSTTTAQIVCYDAAGAAQDSNFTFVVFDNN
jgi:hypothetical protein